jgi:hypothetical protein
MRYVLFLALFLIQLPVMARVVTDNDIKHTLGRPAGEVFGVLTANQMVASTCSVDYPGLQGDIDSAVKAWGRRNQHPVKIATYIFNRLREKAPVQTSQQMTKIKASLSSLIAKLTPAQKSVFCRKYLDNLNKKMLDINISSPATYRIIMQYQLP